MLSIATIQCDKIVCQPVRLNCLLLIRTPSVIMSKNFLKVNWKVIDGAAHLRKMLRLRPTNEGMFLCPVDGCLHVGYKSNRGLRKHIDTCHGWYLYFDKQPNVRREVLEENPEHVLKQPTNWVPSFSLTEGIGKDFLL